MTSCLRNVLNNSLAKNYSNIAKYSLAAKPKPKPKGQCIISCKRKQYDHYTDIHYNKLEEVILASKGWNHSNSKNDFFTVNPLHEELVSEAYSFNDLGINSEVQKALNREGIPCATEFQSRAISRIQNGNHTMLAAETGCGKTIAYLLPIIQRLIGTKPEALNTPQAVVMVPNRELAYQVGEIAYTLGDAVGLKVKIVVGGQTKRAMMNPEFEDIDILVATPGALGKLSTVGIYKLNEAKYVVLDEADTLIDDSFIERLGSLLKRLAQAQTILVSATLPKHFPDVLAPITSQMDHVISPKLHKPLLNISQKFIRLTRSVKPGTLLQLAKPNKEPMLIFTNRSQTCNWLAMFLRENDIPCANINGDMNYALRIEQWNNFVSGKVKVLSATDVGSRGLNTVQVGHVINYDFPLYSADYLHRIGRVGRLGSPDTCRVTNLISGPEEVRLVQQIELAIRRNEALTNVDGNITNIVQNKIRRLMKTNV